MNFDSKSLIQIGLIVLVVIFLMKMMKKSKNRENRENFSAQAQAQEFAENVGILASAGVKGAGEELTKCGQNPGACVGDMFSYKAGLGNAFSAGGVDINQMSPKDIYKMGKIGKDIHKVLGKISAGDLAKGVSKKKLIKRLLGKIVGKAILDKIFGATVDRMMKVFGGSATCQYFKDYKPKESQSLLTSAILLGASLADPTGLSGDVPPIEPAKLAPFSGNQGEGSQVYYMPNAKERAARKIPNTYTKLHTRYRKDYKPDMKNVIVEKIGNHCEHMDHLEGEFHTVDSVAACADKCQAAQNKQVGGHSYMTENGSLNQYITPGSLSSAMGWLVGLEQPTCRFFSYDPESKSCMIADRTWWSFNIGWEDWLNPSCPKGYDCPSAFGIPTGNCYCKGYPGYKAGYTYYRGYHQQSANNCISGSTREDCGAFGCNHLCN